MAKKIEIPEIERLRKELPGFVSAARERNTQPGKELIFAEFMRKVFGVEPEEFSKKMEVQVESKVLLLRGRIDAVFGNLIIEFKVDLDRELKDAERELKKYFQAMKEKFPRAHFLGMATDDLKFKAYKPVFDKKGNVRSRLAA
jgi:hypothetical protein